VRQQRMGLAPAAPSCGPARTPATGRVRQSSPGRTILPAPGPGAARPHWCPAPPRPIPSSPSRPSCIVTRNLPGLPRRRPRRRPCPAQPTAMRSSTAPHHGSASAISDPLPSSRMLRTLRLVGRQALNGWWQAHYRLAATTTTASQTATPEDSANSTCPGTQGGRCQPPCARRVIRYGPSPWAMRSSELRPKRAATAAVLL